jgi:Undecaprenyl-phosphate glucose phosphotransferase
VSQSLPKDDVQVAEPATAQFHFPRLPFQWIGPITVMVELVLIVAASVVSGVTYWHFVLDNPGDIDTFLALGAATFLYYGIVFICRGNYSIGMLTSGGKQVHEVTVVWALTCLCLLGLAFLFKIGPSFSRGATLAFFVLGWLCLVCWRYWVTHIITAANSAGAFIGRNVVLIGDTQVLGRSTWLNELNRYGYNVVKTFTIGDKRQALPVNEVAAATRGEHSANGIFLAVDWTNSREIDQITRDLSVIPLPVWLLPDQNVRRFLGNLPVHVGPLRAAELQRRPLTLAERAAKRTIDLVLASAAMVVLLPLMALVAVLIKFDSPGSALFTQTRGGFNSRPFRIFKFRTLSTRDDASVLRPVCRNDSRLTRLGRILRRTSIDELPQLLNVIRGDMSLVGPRPHPASADSHYSEIISNYAMRHHVKPGLTGWAQVNGFRGEPDVHMMKQRVDFDVWYINNWSLWLDLKIIAYTFVVVLRQPMAY